MSNECEVIEELTVEQCKQLQENLKNKVLIIKFSADWCKPCQKIKPLVNESISKLPQNVIIADIDIDETIDLYMAFRNKKMLSGVPTMLAFYGNVEREHWYVSDANVSGSDDKKIGDFFQKIMRVSSQMNT